MTPRRISYAQNAEDVRVWRAFREQDQTTLRYVDVGANEPRNLSITASLYDAGWRGLLIEADPELADLLRVHRPEDTVVEMAAAAGPGELDFHRVLGTGLGTLDADQARVAAERGHSVERYRVRTDSLDAILAAHDFGEIHFMSIDVEGAEATVLSGLGLRRFRPWILCIEAVHPGTDRASHGAWESAVIGAGYHFTTFDGVNRWYVSREHAELADAVSVPFNALDSGLHGWVSADSARLAARADRAGRRRAWQRETILHDIANEVPKARYEQAITELRGALTSVEGSRSYRYARRAARVVKGGIHRLRRAIQMLPPRLRNGIIRRRHLQHVKPGMAANTHPAYLTAIDPVIAWLSQPPIWPTLPPGMTLEPLSEVQLREVSAWLAQGTFDSDDLLERRLDNHDDELGRVLAALRTRVRLAAEPINAGQVGQRVLIDARCLQSPAFGNRGIGRFARAVVLAAREAVGDASIDLFVDPGLTPLPDSLIGSCRQLSTIDGPTARSFGVFISPSVMTASPDPLISVLRGAARKITVVYDFIPMHYPAVYLAHPAARAEYAAALDALRCFDEFWCISQTTQRELIRVIGPQMTHAWTSEVAWPADLLTEEPTAPRARRERTESIVVMTGDEPRKNTFAGLAAAGAATVDRTTREVVVVGMAGLDDRVHHWSIAAVMRPGEARTAGRLGEDELATLLGTAQVVIVPSFDEGLSLPVIEAVEAGTPVVASDISAHRELLGSGAFLADPASPAALEQAVRRTAGRRRVARAQARRLRRHEHATIESLVAEVFRERSGQPQPADNGPTGAVALPGPVSSRDLRVQLLTPWVPQASGVADFSTAIGIELARICDLTVFTTAGANVEASVPEGLRLSHRPIDEALQLGSILADQSDVIVSVLGNSHFHLPMLQALDRMPAVAVNHDTRMVEMILALRGRGGAEQLLLRSADAFAPGVISPPLDEQIGDMRLLQNLGMWEVARRARMLIMHTPTAAERIERETGVVPRLLPFANQRVPADDAIGHDERERARARLGFVDAEVMHLGCFGYVDARTKMVDTVLEAAGWLTDWGHRVHLHFIGSANDALAAELNARAAELGLHGFTITGFADEETFRDYLVAVDLGVQLRISPVLGVSGPLSDLSAFGTPAVASHGLCRDVDAPPFIEALPDQVSPVIVAEVIERMMSQPRDAAWYRQVEEQRQAYLAGKTPVRYAEALLNLLTEAAT